jgi:pimeloyl-ACP methyl ester carboxylesterase
MNKLIWAILIFSLLAAKSAGADVLVLVHGYLGTAHSWVESGVIHRLQQRGYRQLGIYGYGPGRVLYQQLSAQAAQKPVYAVNLPSQAPIVIQADWLAAILREIRKRHPEEAINLAAHSAGGVVARMTLVRHGSLGVQHLITIATPHFGTGRAIQALDATDESGLLGFAKEWVVRRATGHALYDTIQQSRGVLIDLTPPRPGNLLFWLNGQAHPDIRYTSIMRIGTVYMPGDHVVPPPSQDLNRVPALIGRVKTYSMANGHLLTPQDGDLIGNLLAQDEPSN